MIRFMNAVLTKIIFKSKPQSRSFKKSFIKAKFDEKDQTRTIATKVKKYGRPRCGAFKSAMVGLATKIDGNAGYIGGVRLIQLDNPTDSNNFIYWDDQELKIGPASNRISAEKYKFKIRVLEEEEFFFASFETIATPNIYVTAENHELKLKKRKGTPGIKDPRSFIEKGKDTGAVKLESVTQKGFHWYAFLEQNLVGLSKENVKSNIWFHYVSEVEIDKALSALSEDEKESD